jgi:hypothetical protein
VGGVDEVGVSGALGGASGHRGGGGSNLGACSQPRGH